MPVSAIRTTITQFSGDVTAVMTLDDQANNNSPGQTQVMNLVAGPNTILVPTGGAVTRSCTIEPPVSNTVLLTLKGVAGDTGVAINLVNPMTLSLDPSQLSFVLTAAAALTGLRLTWT